MRSFRTEKKLRLESRDFHEIDETTIGSNEGINLSRVHAGTPDSQSMIADTKEGREGSQVWVKTDWEVTETHKSSGQPDM